MKKRQLILLALSVFLLGSTLSFGNTIIYPANAPVFSISFPDDWKVELDKEMIHAGPPDNSIYFGLWALEDPNNLDAALDALDESIASMVSNLELGEVDTTIVNGIRFLSVDGSGKDTEGDAVIVSVAIFTPDDEAAFILVYFGTPEADKLHEDELISILQSVSGSMDEEEQESE